LILGYAGAACEHARVTDLTVRVAASDEYDKLRLCFADAMMIEWPADETGRALFEPERALAVDDGDEVVATARALTRDLSVPGAVVPAAHVTGVGVRATHRRKGILSRLMTRQLQDAAEAFAVLWASEPAIYGRFGYAPAAWGTTYEIELPRVRPKRVEDPGRLREIPVDGAGTVLAPLLAEYQQFRPGVSSRTAPWWENRLSDPSEGRQGRSALKLVVHENVSGTIDGYALSRNKLNWNAGGPAGEVSLEELVALDFTAYGALWQHFFTMDLATVLRFNHGAIDEPVQQLVANPEALNRRIGETLWIRITDVARALEQRRYATAVDVVFEVTDTLLPANSGRYHLTADEDKVRCERTDDPADLALSITDLAAVYLGGRTLTEFARTGRVRELQPGTLTRATAAFGWPIAPASIEIF
jgi:predicted acetyltransferase